MSDESAADDRDGVTVVLGWDALDHEVTEEFGLSEAFGPHHAPLETFDNPVLGKPHTYELWPSIVTGVTPDEHGIHAATEGEGVDWGNPLIARASRLAQGVVPKSVRTKIGQVLRESGAELDFEYADYYAERGVSTVFDGRRARSVAIPNHRVEADDELDLVFDRGAQLGAFLNIQNVDGDHTRHFPKVPLPELEERLVAECAKKLGVVRAALRREHDIVFVWLGYLDTVGHLAPVVAEEDPGWQERAYRLAASMTEEIRDEMQPEDTLVCVSDHGLQDGDHTPHAFVGASDERAIEGVESVLDVREGLERVTPKRSPVDEVPVREAFQFGGRVGAKDADEVRGQLEDLGYL
ncbi:alkaline phosphatase family protein [Haloglomus litoreum]|uniref:alkaline phosphatase family protein n=1 Tax=Haloglomus litoreum TaxID=3034026 RepID=UPI0023E7F6E9|nr:alkaline phosphatase family protein [Haloglomus sp. DT116]